MAAIIDRGSWEMTMGFMPCNTSPFRPFLAFRNYNQPRRGCSYVTIPARAHVRRRPDHPGAGATAGTPGAATVEARLAARQPQDRGRIVGVPIHLDLRRGRGVHEDRR